MHELVLVLSDFYVSQEAPDRELPAGVTLPGLQQVARFGTRSKTHTGWRPWLSRWLTGADGGATATVAAAALPALNASTAAAMASAPAAPGITAAATTSRHAAPLATAAMSSVAAGTMPPASVVVGTTAPASVAWVATPMHLIAGMTSVHVDRRSILRLDAADQQTIAADFQRVFQDSGFQLQPLDAGDFLMLGPEMSAANTEEPARSMGASLAHRAGASPALRKLGAEIEMWLHDHAINDTRRGRGEQPVTALWLWGGGPITAGDVGLGGRALTSRVGPTSRSGTDVGGTPTSTAAGPSGPDIAFGRDSYLQGLWAQRGATVLPLPQQITNVFSYPEAQRAALVIEIGVMLQSNPKWSFFEAVVDIDRRFIAPAVEALNAGQCDRLIVLANDYELTLRARDRFKFWRRTPAGLSGLQ